MSGGTFAAIYARSADPSSDEHGIARQIEACEALVEREGLTLCEVLVDEGSAFARRRGFERLVEIARDGEIDTVVVWRADRLARSWADLGRLVNVEVVEVNR